MTPRSTAIALCIAALTPAAARAQLDRYELGARLRDLERQLLTCADDARLDAGFQALDRSVMAFFRLDFRGALEAMAQAQMAVAGQDDDAIRFAHSLQWLPAARCIDAAQATAAFELRAAYPCELPGDAPFKLTIRRAGDDVPLATAKFRELPLRGELPLAGLGAGDHELVWAIAGDGRVLLERPLVLSLVERLAARLDALEQSAAAQRPQSLATATLSRLVRRLQVLGRQRGEETDVRAAALVAESERIAAALAAGEPAFADQFAGDHWLAVPVAGSVAIARLFVPADIDGPRPLVVALHGAGGSENLFFDGYGNGLAVQLARTRGWFLVAPRASTGGVDVPQLIDQLAQHWSIDRSRVVVVGHSMGAMQAVAAASRNPDRFRAVAALGGGGRPARLTELRAVPFFVAAGERDFGRSQAEALHRALAAAGVPTTLRVVPRCEHFAIVQFALPETFAGFDRALEPR